MLESPHAVGVMQFHAISAKQLRTEPLPGRCVLLRMADDEGLLAPVFDAEKVAIQRDLIFADAEESYGGVDAPTRHHAYAILAFQEHAASVGIEHFVAQCQAGVGRSVAVCAALAKIRGEEFRPPPTYNRKLYRDLLREGGLEPPAEPLVSITVRCKYHPEYKLKLFLLSMLAQRYANWECIAYTDGANDYAHRVAVELEDERIRVLDTPERKGRWGHPYRQMAFEQCRGEWIGTQNDDNYLTPGFIEQLVTAGEDTGADLVACQALHRYHGWDVTLAGNDLACWLARRSLLSRYRWTGDGFTADAEFFDTLRFGAGRKLTLINRPLVVKN